MIEMIPFFLVQWHSLRNFKYECSPIHYYKYNWQMIKSLLANIYLCVYLYCSKIVAKIEIIVYPLTGITIMSVYEISSLFHRFC